MGDFRKLSGAAYNEPRRVERQIGPAKGLGMLLQHHGAAMGEREPRGWGAVMQAARSAGRVARLLPAASINHDVKRRPPTNAPCPPAQEHSTASAADSIVSTPRPAWLLR